MFAASADNTFSTIALPKSIAQPAPLPVITLPSTSTGAAVYVAPSSSFIVMLTDAQRIKLETLYPSEFNYEFSPENQEYVYLSEDLINLSGRKFHAKRNHISKFKNTYPNFRFEEITNSNKEDAYKVMLDWCTENDIDIENYEEKHAIRESLDNMEEFKMRGGIVYVDSKAVAMTLGCEISPIAFDICFEKALREYDGIYAVINNEFAKTLSSYKYINREEDMGLEGLKKSKLSYNPVILLARYNATLKKDEN